MNTDTAFISTDDYVSWYQKSFGQKDQAILFGRGYAIIDNSCLEGQDLIDRIALKCIDAEGSFSVELLKQLVKALDGGWALVVIWSDGRAFAATDRSRSIPLFYVVKAKGILFAPSSKILVQSCDALRVNNFSALEFLLAGFISGSSTLYENIYKLQPGEMVEFLPQDTVTPIRKTRYYYLYPGDYICESEKTLEHILGQIIHSSFEPIAKWLSGRKVYVPLSGGFDSRLIVAMLKKMGVQNVTCFTYGVRDNEESRISRSVAEALGYSWEFFEYKPETWKQLIGSEVMTKYWRFASKGISIPVFQDFPALLMLRENAGEWDHPVFFPGHSADMLAGGHISDDYEQFQSHYDMTTMHIFHHHYWSRSLWPKKKDLTRGNIPSLLSKIERLSSPPLGAEPNSIGRYEMFDFENRQSMFIINSVRAYEFLHGSWCSLWLNQLMDFFMKVPLEYRVHKRLYINTLRKHVFIGSESKLAEIPIARYGQIADPSTMWSRISHCRNDSQNTWSYRMKQLSVSLGFGNFLERHLRKPAVNPMFFPWWFSKGIDPSSLTVAEALRPWGTLEKLPKCIFPFVKSHLSRRLDWMPCNSLLSIVMLGELCKGDF
ncbi:MAG: hypothetical protein JW849_07980 [Phycisphaerae bacterium]|nr:hypothetical protein [Phycisphaerae bacterium]